MTAFLTYALVCDVCGEVFYSKPPARRAGSVRLEARGAGWVHFLEANPKGAMRPTDLCPVHATTKDGERAMILIEDLPKTLPADLAEYVATVLRSLLHTNDLSHDDWARRALLLLEGR